MKPTKAKKENRQYGRPARTGEAKKNRFTVRVMVLVNPRQAEQVKRYAKENKLKSGPFMRMLLEQYVQEKNGAQNGPPNSVD